MVATKQTYTINAGFGRATVASALRSALIDAGLMTEWYDIFSSSSAQLCAVLEIRHDTTKTYGSSYYYFTISDTGIGVALATGWKASGTAPINVPTGTQYIDWHTLPANSFAGGDSTLTSIFTWSTASNLFLDRYTSGSDSKQSWFVFRQPATVSRSSPFTFLHKDTSLHSWLDLSKGCISGFSQALLSAGSSPGLLRFVVQENIRRCLAIGGALRGITSGVYYYHAVQLNIYSYYGVSSISGGSSNIPAAMQGAQFGAGTPLPVGRNSANPAFTTDYVPVCTNIPWSYFTPTRLADDLGVYLDYGNNDIAIGDKFIVQSGINEWEVVGFANSSNLNDGGSVMFLARIV